MTKVQAGRLLTLAWFLRTEVPRHKFYMGRYADGPTCEISQHDCGTSACAIGWATVVFPAVFTLKELYLGYLHVHGRFSDYSELPVRDFFGIDSENAAEDLFGPNHDRTPKQEAKVIEDFVLSKGWTYA